MPMRYFKATNGRFTVFRGTTQRVYASAWINCSGTRVINWGLSMKATNVYPLPAEEIARTEYEELNQRKIERMVAAGGNPKWAAPSDSWVSNEALT
jgi:hypothetical protein